MKLECQNYIAVARIDRWKKGIFVLIGSLLASFLNGKHIGEYYILLILALISVSLISSANYVLNEISDKDTDKFHPLKRDRAVRTEELNISFARIQYFVLLGMGLYFAATISSRFLIVAIIFALSAIMYNVSPIRTKDIIILDVLTDSFSSPLRLLFGWFAVVSVPMPPMSLILSFWTAGAFFMNNKRCLECQLFGESKEIIFYRKAFRIYSRKILHILSVFYGVCFVVFFCIFCHQVTASW